MKREWRKFKNRCPIHEEPECRLALKAPAVVLQATMEDNSMAIDSELEAGWAKSQQGIAEMMVAALLEIQIH